MNEINIGDRLEKVGNGFIERLGIIYYSIPIIIILLFNLE